MPLQGGKSRKAFEHNVRTEMEHGKPQAQSLAIAYSMKRKGKKRMAEGGTISAKSEPRPAPDQTHNNSKQVSENRHSKSNGPDKWTDRPTEAQAVNNSGRMVKPIKRPRMVPSDAFSTKLYDQEGNLMATLHPSSPETQPDKSYDEDGANRQGPKVHDMQPEHSTHRKPYAKGGQIEPGDSESHNIHEHTGMEPEDSGMEERLRMEEGDIQSRLDHGSDEEMADSLDEENQDSHGHPVRDMERQHNNGRMPYARGGEVSPQDEIDMEHEDSIAAAIMAKKARESGHPAAMSDSDIDEMIHLYDGGEVDLSINHDEEPNNEDQMSFQALKKENYNDSDLDIDQPEDSNEDSPEHEKMDEHDEGITSEIRKRMKHRQFKNR